jgi:hypothetical protein
LCHLTTFRFRLDLTDIWFKRVIRDQNKYFDTNYRHFRHWKILPCHDVGYQMSIFFKKLYIKLKPLISRLIKSVILFNGSNASTSVTYKVCCLSIFEVKGLKPGQVFSSTFIGITFERNKIFSWCKFHNKEDIKGFNAQFLKKYLFKNNKLCILLILEI